MGNEWILLTFACLSVLAAGLFSAAARGEVLGEDWRVTAAFAFISLCLSALSGLSALFSLGTRRWCSGHFKTRVPEFSGSC